VITAASLSAALAWSAIASALTWFALYPVRRRHLAGVFASIVLTGTTASIGALVGGIHEMLLPMHQWVAIVLLTIAAGLFATVCAGLAARRLTHDNRALRHAVSELAAGRVPARTDRMLTVELESLRDDLASTATALAATRERERTLEAARRELVAWVSHDLRTPLAGLRAMSEALEDGVVEDQHLYFKQIAAATDRLSTMVDDLFELSRIQAGNVTGERKPIELGELVADCVASLRPLAGSEGVHLDASIQSTLSVVGNAESLHRVLTNLTANAIRHTPAGGTVDLVVSGGGASADVTVLDECGGIPANDLPRVFDVGFRGESARTPARDDRSHAGLGLAIAKGIVDAHDGTLDVHNTAAGCAFRVSLPVDSAGHRAPRRQDGSVTASSNP
jgi:signal transduction histidine kinase